MASEDEAVTVLEQLDALLAPAEVEGAGAASIRFARISGAAPTPLGHLFPRADGPAGPAGPLGADDKLAGNQLFNFGAFLKPSWRQNDWMWGRLDAAAHLVDLLTQPARLRAFAAGAGAVAEGVQRVVTSPVVGVDPRVADAWRTLTTELWAGAADDVVAELDAMLTGGSDAEPVRTRAVLTARLQWEVLAVEVPMLDATARADALRDAAPLAGVLRWLAGRRPRPTPPVPDVVPMSPLEVAGALGAHAVGIADVRGAFGDRRVQLLVGDLAAGTWRAALTRKVGRRNVLPAVGAAVLRPLAALVTRSLGR
jgi:hypothetical protein